MKSSVFTLAIVLVVAMLGMSTTLGLIVTHRKDDIAHNCPNPDASECDVFVAPMVGKLLERKDQKVVFIDNPECLVKKCTDKKATVDLSDIKKGGDTDLYLVFHGLFGIEKGKKEAEGKIRVQNSPTVDYTGSHIAQLLLDNNLSPDVKNIYITSCFGALLNTNVKAVDTDLYKKLKDTHPIVHVFAALGETLPDPDDSGPFPVRAVKFSEFDQFSKAKGKFVMSHFTLFPDLSGMFSAATDTKDYAQKVWDKSKSTAQELYRGMLGAGSAHLLEKGKGKDHMEIRPRSKEAEDVLTSQERNRSKQQKSSKEKRAKTTDDLPSN